MKVLNFGLVLLNQPKNFQPVKSSETKHKVCQFIFMLRIEPQPDIFEKENHVRDTVAKGLERISETDKEKAG